MTLYQPIHIQTHRLYPRGSHWNTAGKPSGLLGIQVGRHTPLGQAHLCWINHGRHGARLCQHPFQSLVFFSVLTHMRTLLPDLNITGAAIVAAATAVTLTLTVGLRLICTFRHDTG
jgi:hypothetical protein